MHEIIKFLLAAYIPSAVCVFLYTYSSYKLDRELNDEKIYRLNEAGILTWQDHAWFYGNMFIPVWNVGMALLIISIEASDHFVQWLTNYLYKRAMDKLYKQNEDVLRQ